MLKIKLSPVGKKHDRQFRIVVMEERSKITSDAIANLGTYNPKSNAVIVEENAVNEWIRKGAQPTAKIKTLLKLD
jgi:small subunit ribosomal protein S16